MTTSATVEEATVEAGWIPTAAAINALPEPLRRYIANIETSADPAGMVAENILVKDENAMLRAKLADMVSVMEIERGAMSASLAAGAAESMALRRENERLRGEVERLRREATRLEDAERWRRVTGRWRSL